MNEKKYHDTALFLKKQPIVRDYINADGQTKADHASRGFSIIPGQLVESMTVLELVLKLQISQANFDVMREMVSRRITTLNLTSQKEIKEKFMEFELRKMSMLNTLQMSYSSVLRSISDEDFDITQQRADLDIREMALEIALRDINIEIEEHKQRQISADAETLDDERILSYAKAATANAKLAVIEPLRALIKKERELIGYEQDINIPLLEEQLIEEQKAIDAELLLINPTIRNANLLRTLAATELESITYIISRADAQKAYASGIAATISPLLAAATAELLANQALMSILPARERKALARLNYATNMLTLADAEVILASARLAYAQKQGELINPLTSKAVEYGNLAAKNILLADAIAAEVLVKKSIAEEKVALATAKSKSLSAEIDVLVEEAGLEKILAEVSALRAQYTVEQKSTEYDKAIAEVNKIITLLADKQAYLKQKLENISYIGGEEAKSERIIADNRRRGRADAALHIAGLESAYYEQYAYDRYEEATGTADKAAAATIVGELQHLIG